MEDFAALFLAAGEAFVDRAGGELPVDLQEVHLGVEAFVVGGGVEFLALGHAGLDGGAEEVGDGDTGDFARVLEGEEEAGAGAFIHFHGEDGFAVDEDVAAHDGVVRVAGNGFGEGGLAGAVGAHDRMDFAGADGQRKALDDRAVTEVDVEIQDCELAAHRERESEGGAGRVVRA